VEAIEKAQIDKFDCAVLDDGFQDSSVFKDLNIICFNQDQLIGNGMSIPSGPLREPFSSIKNSQIILINGESNESFEKKIKAVSKNISIYYSNYVPTNLNYFKDQNLLAFAGIGNPDNFFSLLEKNNLNIIKKIPFPDHYQYTIKELNDLVNFSAKNNLKIITTEKDYCRIKNYNIQQIQYLHVDLEIKNKEEFAREVVRCLH
jgi:tetraacyldisaccharide 4'-kinase